MMSEKSLHLELDQKYTRTFKSPDYYYSPGGMYGDRRKVKVQVLLVLCRRGEAYPNLIRTRARNQGQSVRIDGTRSTQCVISQVMG